MHGDRRTVSLAIVLLVALLVYPAMRVVQSLRAGDAWNAGLGADAAAAAKVHKEMA